MVVLDDLSTGFRDAVASEAVFYQADIRDQRAVQSILRDNDIETVFHFAAKALIPESMSNPGLFFEENVASGILFLEAVRRAGIRRFVFSSSAAVYGNPEVVPICEEQRKEPVNSYGETKLMFERILAWYARAYQWGVAVLRYFNACGAYGELGERHHPETHIIPLLLQAALGENDSFNIYGTDYNTPDGTCMRDYVHVLDIADAHICAVDSLDSAGLDAYNIGTGVSHSVREILGVAEIVTGKKIAVHTRARRPGDPAVLCASPLKLKARLGWESRNSDLNNIMSTAWRFQQSLRKELYR